MKTLRSALLILATVLLVFTGGCVKQTVPPPPTPAQEVIQTLNTINDVFNTMCKSWNEKDWATYGTVFHKDLKAKVYNSDGSVSYWDYQKQTSTAPDRREKVGVVYLKSLRVLEFTNTTAKVEVILERGNREAPNTFNLVIDNGIWRIISND